MYKGEKDNFGVAQLANMEKRKSESNIRRPHPVDDNLEKGIVAGGEKIYNVYCGSCHQSNGLGASGRFPPLAGTSWVTGDKKRLVQLVLEGLEGQIEVNGISFNALMPQHSFLKDEEIANVLTFIRQNFGNKASGIKAIEVAAARNISEP